MNGVHDMGGMHGFGPIPIEENEPVFHENWEARALAMTLALAGWQRWNLDRSRYAREALPPAEYLSMSYYERWIAALVDLAVENGLLSREELRQGRPAPDSEQSDPPVTAERVREILSRGGPTAREAPAAPGFSVGDPVRTRNIHPAGHTRLPRYARDKCGEVVLHHGAHVFADAHARGQGEQPQHLYTVRFSARELWGEQASPKDSVHIDLWEPHLDAR